MEIQQLKKQLARLKQTFEAAAEMCERRTPTSRVNAYLASIHQDSNRLQWMLEHPGHDSRYEDCLQHLKATIALLTASCEKVDHKDTQLAIRRLTGEVESLQRSLH